MTDPNPAFAYGFTTDPDPIQASPANGPTSTTTLTIVVSNSTGQFIACQSITFSFLVGDLPDNLSNDATGIQSFAPTGWKITQSGGVFTAKPDTTAAGLVGPAALVFTLSGIKVNQQPGTFNLTVTEVAAGKTTTWPVPFCKFPASFALSPLTANPLTVAMGGSVTLSWSGTAGPTYELQYENSDGNTVTITHPKGEAGQPLPATGSYLISDLEDNPTVFTLIVTMQLNGGAASAQRQVSVSVAELTVALEATPTTVAVNGVTKLSWRTTEAVSCVLDPGNQQVPTNGHRFVVVTQENQTFTVTAIGKDPGVSRPAQVTVSFDATIVPTQTINKVGADGGFGGTPGGFQVLPGNPGGDGAPGTSVTMSCNLDPSSKPATVVLINTSGGNGGQGGTGNDGTWAEGGGDPANPGGAGGPGGHGGDAGAITLNFDSTQPPAGYIVVADAGKGGARGSGGDGYPVGGPGAPGVDGKPGTITLQDG